MKSLLDEFASVLGVRIQVFAWGLDNQGNNTLLIPEDCKKDGLENCLNTIFSFGDVKDTDNTIYIVSFGMTHFQLLTSIDIDNANYKLSENI